MRHRLRSLLSAIRLLALWEELRGSFWFLPALMVVGTIVLSFAMTAVDSAIEEDVYGSLEVFYLFGPEGARAILSAIASSMITVAGLTFSITMLTLQLASSQFGPRLLRNFMRDRGNQFVLGTFISTFVYCLLVLRTVKGVEGASFVPHISVAIGVLLALASLAILIYFIHHIAHSIRIEPLLASLAAETRDTIDRLYPERLGHGADPEAPPRPHPDFALGHPIRPARSGYLQFVDGDALLALAGDHDLVVRINVPPGSFVTERDPVMTAVSAGPLSDDVMASLCAAMIVGDERTPHQDLQFSIRRIVEIGQRSLSPGINDPTTALYCIDRLSEAFVRLAVREAPARERFDSDGHLRVVTETVGFEQLACNAFAAVARYAGSDDDVLDGLEVALGRVIEAAAPEAGRRLAILRDAVRRKRLPQTPWGLAG
jgi:uncharacterized membrane protein